MNKDLLISKEVFKKVFDLSPEAIVILDKKGKVVNINSRVKAWLGYEIDEVVGKNIVKLPFLTKRSVLIAGKSLALRLSGKKVSPYELEFKTKKGDMKTGRVTGSLIKDGKHLVGDLVMITDVTEEKKEVVNIIESDERFRSLFDNMKDGVAIYESIDNGKNFIIKNINRAGQRISNVDLEKIKGKKVTEAFPGIKEMGLFDVLQEVYKTGKPKIHPSTNYKDNQLVGWFENEVFKLRSGEVVAIYQDLTMQVKVQRDLAKNEERLKYALQGTNDGLWDWDIISNKVYFSPRWKEIIGYRDNEIKNDFQEWEKRLHPKDKDRVLKYVDDYIKSGGKGKFENEFRMIHKQGNHVDIFARAFLVKGLSGRPVRLVGTHLDITERKHETLRYKQLLENMKSGVAIFKVNDNGSKFYYSEYNKAAEKIEGKKRAQVIGREVGDVFPNAESMGTTKIFKKVTKTGQPQYLPEVKYKDHKGKISYREVYTYKLPSGEIVSIYDDITNQVLRRKEIKQAIEKNESLVKSFAQIVYEHDLITDNIIWRGEINNMLGYSLEEMGNNSKGWLSKAHPDDLARVEEELEQAKKEKRNFSMEYRFKKKNGEYGWFHDRGVISFNKKGVAVYNIGVMEDITDRKNYEVNLKNKIEELSKLNKLMVGREKKMIELKEKIKKLES